MMHPVSFPILRRLRAYNLTAQREPCVFEVADGGIGMDGTIKRNRAYRKKVPTWFPFLALPNLDLSSKSNQVNFIHPRLFLQEL